ncbi:MAG: hypothetical protein ACRCWY_08925 [Cellulosilyticaceae bacterium]
MWGEKNNRRAFKKEMKAYKKRLEERAEKGVLTMNEKEEYQRLCYSRQRKRMAFEDRAADVIKGFAILMFLGLMSFTRGLWGTEMEVEAYVPIEDSEWASASPNDEKSVKLEIGRINKIFEERMALQRTLVQHYTEKGTLPEDYEAQIQSILAASPYSELGELIGMQEEYKALQREYWGHIGQAELIDQAYITKQEEAMKTLVEAYNTKSMEWLLLGD